MWISWVKPLMTMIDACFALLVTEARRVGPVLRVRLTPADYPFQVVRVIVPGLEFYTADTDRVGARLHRQLLARHAAG